MSLYASYNQDNNWCTNVFACVPVEIQTSSVITPNTLPICDHNADGVTNLSDVSLFATCIDTFDANGDGVHGLADLSLYASYNQDSAWCATNFVCDITNPSASSGGKINFMEL